MSDGGIVEGSQLPEAVTDTGMVLPDDLSFEGWEAAARFVRQSERGWQWWLADITLWAVEHGLEHQAVQALTNLGFADQTLSNKQWIASRFPHSRRREDLSFSHHEVVAALDPADADMLLERAVVDKWSRDDLRWEVRRFQEKTATPDNPAPRRHRGPQSAAVKYNGRLRAPREERDVKIEPAEEINLLEFCQEAWDLLREFGAQIEKDPRPDPIQVKARAAVDKLLEVIETCERLGCEPI